MALRFLLVSLVAGLGVDLPGGDEMLSWVRSGRDWVQARIDQMTGPASDGAASESAEADDLAFSGVVDRMADSFGADLASTDRRPSFEPLDVPVETLVGVAHDLNRDAQGIGVAIETPAGPTIRVETPAPARLDRVVTAVRLTRQAASAWLTVFGERSTFTASR